MDTKLDNALLRLVIHERTIAETLSSGRFDPRGRTIGELRFEVHNRDSAAREVDDLFTAIAVRQEFGELIEAVEAAFEITLRATEASAPVSSLPVRRKDPFCLATLSWLVGQLVSVGLRHRDAAPDARLQLGRQVEQLHAAFHAYAYYRYENPL